MVRVREENSNYRGGHEIPCTLCGKMKWFKPYKIKKQKNLFCSRECYVKWSKGENTTNWQDGSIKKKCVACGKTFTVSKGEFKRGNVKYCSRKCCSEHRKRQIEVICINCNKIYYVSEHKLKTTKYCSKKCQHESLKKYDEIQLRILHNLRTRTWMALNGKIKKSTTTIELLGCSIEYFKQHIEKKFKKGMSWENYGFNGWHIDHIKPCSSFDLTYLKQQKECFNYRNLQPLWAEENYAKAQKILN